MSTIRTTTLERDLPAREVDRRLRAAVAELRRAERNAVLWFAEVLRRRLYHDLGFGSIQQYAEVALGFGPGKTAQFVRLAGALRELPRLRASVAHGEVTWTQARTVAAVATPETEVAWLAAARKTSSRGLEAQVRLARRRAASARVSEGQVSLGLHQGVSGEGRARPAAPEVRQGPTPAWPQGEGGSAGSVARNGSSPPLPPVGSLPLPRSVQLRFSPEQGARYEALLEAARKQGVRGDQAEVLLAGLEALVTAAVRTRVRPASADPEGGEGKGGYPKGSDPKGGGGGGGNGEPERSGQGGEGGKEGAEREPERGGACAGGSGKEPNRIFASPYQVLVRLCPSCAGGSVVTGRGAESLHPDTLRAILCDARVRRPGKRNQAVIPARVRREVLERDGHRCRSSGCGSARFLAVHHKTPREAGGTNAPENLITLCASCHRAIHGHAGTGGRGDGGLVRSDRGAGALGGNGALSGDGGNGGGGGVGCGDAGTGDVEGASNRIADPGRPAAGPPLPRQVRAP